MGLLLRFKLVAGPSFVEQLLNICVHAVPAGSVFGFPGEDGEYPAQSCLEVRGARYNIIRRIRYTRTQIIHLPTVPLDVLKAERDRLLLGQRPTIVGALG